MRILNYLEIDELPGNGPSTTVGGPPLGDPIGRRRAEPAVTVVDEHATFVVHETKLMAPAPKARLDDAISVAPGIK